MTQDIMSCNIGDYGFTRTHTHEHEGIIMQKRSTEKIICPECSGAGRVYKIKEGDIVSDKCPLCKGSGLAIKMIIIDGYTSN